MLAFILVLIMGIVLYEIFAPYRKVLIVLGVITLPITIPAMTLFLDEQLFVKCDELSTLNRVEGALLMALERRAEEDMKEFSNTRQVVVRHIIYHKKPYMINVSTDEALKDNTIRKEYSDYESQVKRLKNWKYLKYQQLQEKE